MPEVTQKEWLEYIRRFPQAHLLQTPAWGVLKSGFDWQPAWVLGGGSGAQVLFRQLRFGFTIAYIPKGPLGEDWDSLWPEVDAVCASHRAIFLKVEQDCWEDGEVDLLEQGFKASPHSIQPRRTITLDIGQDEETLLAAMKQKTRYNIRLAEKKGVVVKASDDVQAFSEMMDETGQRDDFGVHTLAYYQRAYQLFHPEGYNELLVAEYEGQPLAGLMVFARGERAWYLYGASNNLQRNLMPTYLLQWEAIRWAKRRGCKLYDLWGVPDNDENTLEAQFMERSEGLWGVYRFKRGFGGQLRRSGMAWDRVYKPLPYQAYNWMTSTGFLKNAYYQIKRLFIS